MKLVKALIVLFLQLFLIFAPVYLVEEDEEVTQTALSVVTTPTIQIDETDETIQATTPKNGLIEVNIPEEELFLLHKLRNSGTPVWSWEEFNELFNYRHGEKQITPEGRIQLNKLIRKFVFSDNAKHRPKNQKNDTEILDNYRQRFRPTPAHYHPKYIQITRSPKLFHPPEDTLARKALTKLLKEMNFKSGRIYTKTIQNQTLHFFSTSTASPTISYKNISLQFVSDSSKKHSTTTELPYIPVGQYIPDMHLPLKTLNEVYNYYRVDYNGSMIPTLQNGVERKFWNPTPRLIERGVVTQDFPLNSTKQRDLRAESERQRIATDPFNKWYENHLREMKLMEITKKRLRELIEHFRLLNKTGSADVNTITNKTNVDLLVTTLPEEHLVATTDASSGLKKKKSN